MTQHAAPTAPAATAPDGKPANYVPAGTLVKFGAGVGAPVVGGIGWILSSLLGVQDRLATLEARQDLQMQVETRAESRLETAIAGLRADIRDLRQEMPRAPAASGR